MLADRSYKSEQLRINANTNHSSFNNSLGSNQLFLHGYDEVFCVDTEEEATASKCPLGKEKQNGHTPLKTPPILAPRCFLPSPLDLCGTTRFTFDAQRSFYLNKRTPRSPRSPGEPSKADLTPLSAPPSDSTHPVFPRQAAFSSSGSLLGDLCGVPLFFMPSLSQVDPLTGSIEDPTKQVNGAPGPDIPPVSEPCSQSSDVTPASNAPPSDSSSLPLSAPARRKLSGAKNSKKSAALSKHTTNSTVFAGNPDSETQRTCNNAVSYVDTPKNASKTAPRCSKEKRPEPANDVDTSPTIPKPQKCAGVRIPTELVKPDSVSLPVFLEPQVTVRTATSDLGESASSGSIGDDSDFTVVTNKKSKSRPKQGRCPTIPTLPLPPRSRRVGVRAPMVWQGRSPPHQASYAINGPSNQAPRRYGPPQSRSHQTTSAPSHQTQASGRPSYHQRPARPAETSTFAQVVSRSVTESELPKPKHPKPTARWSRPDSGSVNCRKTESIDCSESVSCTAESSVSSPLTPSSEMANFSELSLSSSASPVPEKLSKQHLILTDFMTNAWSSFSKSLQ